MAESTEAVLNLEVSETELKIINDVMRQHKLNVTTEEVLLFSMGKAPSPLLSLVLRIASMYEKHMAEKVQPEVPPTTEAK